jgi:hypothetical protein
MKDITRYKIMRKFRDERKIGDDLLSECPDPNFYIGKRSRCEKLCLSIFKNIENCPCDEYGCSTALRKLDIWLRNEKKRLGVKE